MASVVRIPDRETLEAEAAAWVAQLDGGEPSDADRAAFREWLERSPRHRAEFLRLAGVWDALDDMYDPQAEPSLRRARFGWRRASGLAAAAAALALVVVAGFLPRGEDEPGSLAVYEAGLGEQTTSVLADGTELVLNTSSRAEVELRDDRRVVRLLKGEALFDIAPDPARPFTVYAGDGAVEALGTVFAVRLEDDTLEVAVSEGRIQVYSTRGHDGAPLVGAQSPTPIAVLEAGQLGAFGRSIKSVETLDSEALERKLAWREGRLIFDDVTLAQAIEEITRYTATEIIISDPEIRELRIGGYFGVGDTDALLSALRDRFGIEVLYVRDDLVYLSRATN